MQWQVLPIFPELHGIGQKTADHRSMINVWSPLICPFKSGNEHTFSLRSRIQSEQMLGSEVTGRFMHLLAVPTSSDTTTLYEFSRNLYDQHDLDIGTSWLMTKTSNTNNQAIDVSNHELLNAQFTTPPGMQRPVDGRVNFKSWTSAGSDINMRFLTAKLTRNATDISPDLVTWEVNYGQEIVTVFDTTTAHDGPTKVFSQTLTGPMAGRHSFIKSYGTGLLAVRCGSKTQETKFYKLQEQNGNKTFIMEREYHLGGLERFAIPIDNHCVLIGDIMGTGKPQMVLTTTRSMKRKSSNKSRVRPLFKGC